jgi:hypothetical protein
MSFHLAFALRFYRAAFALRFYRAAFALRFYRGAFALQWNWSGFALTRTSSRREIGNGPDLVARRHGCVRRD